MARGQRCGRSEQELGLGTHWVSRNGANFSKGPTRKCHTRRQSATAQSNRISPSTQAAAHPRGSASSTHRMISTTPTDTTRRPENPKPFSQGKRVKKRHSLDRRIANRQDHPNEPDHCPCSTPKRSIQLSRLKKSHHRKRKNDPIIGPMNIDMMPNGSPAKNSWRIPTIAHCTAKIATPGHSRRRAAHIGRGRRQLRPPARAPASALRKPARRRASKPSVARRIAIGCRSFLAPVGCECGRTKT